MPLFTLITHGQREFIKVSIIQMPCLLEMVEIWLKYLCILITISCPLSKGLQIIQLHNTILYIDLIITTYWYRYVYKRLEMMTIRDKDLLTMYGYFFFQSQGWNQTLHKCFFSDFVSDKTFDLYKSKLKPPFGLYLLLYKIIH